MTRTQKDKYKSAEALRQLLWQTLAGRKFKLQCGHHITFGQQLANDIAIKNGAKGFKVICSLCSY